MANDLDCEREYRARTGKILKRRDPCANSKRRGAAKDCPRLAKEGRSYCSANCSNQAWARDKEKFAGGSVQFVAEMFGSQDEPETPPTRNPTSRR